MNFRGRVTLAAGMGAVVLLAGCSSGDGGEAAGELGDTWAPVTEAAQAIENCEEFLDVKLPSLRNCFSIEVQDNAAEAIHQAELDAFIENSDGRAKLTDGPACVNYMDTTDRVLGCAAELDVNGITVALVAEMQASSLLLPNVEDPATTVPYVLTYQVYDEG